MCTQCLRVEWSIDAHSDATDKQKRGNACDDDGHHDPGKCSSHRGCSFWRILLMVGAVLFGSQVTTFEAYAYEGLTAHRLRPAPDDPDAFVVDGHYLRGVARLKRMRAQGQLPDTIADGKCRFELAGDPGVAYYVRSCQ